ncbi:FAD:protein FMN transferase [Simkania negevensis]|uniref:FAD:protein FMN transferase n=1 Tax=Simkania negevensis (strain ATCC VR-1471 / DSM 27360 / Z) TaxID=331113 RepID=F8L7R7_SIMNZ|nr:FAD:protein FMN transferase [Simkania negevensis]CCB88810.1 thiamine biosynthesis lipoprotein ApbE [Simkania negevensis Z]
MHIILFLLLLLLSGCKGTTTTHFHGNAHTHDYHIHIGHALSQHEKEDVFRILEEVFEAIDLYYNHWNPHSELSQINHLLVGETYPISPQLLSLIQEAKSITALTDGHFDPTYGAVTSVWKEALKTHARPPSLDFLPVGWETFSFEQGLARRLIEGTLLDLDGLIKGFAIDTLIEKLHEKGYSNLYVEWGGDIRALGKHPSGRSWNVSLPSFEDTPIPLDMALATSGVQEQSTEIEGKLCTHIVIPQTKEATTTLDTVSVKAPTCLMADALATALMTYPSIDEALKFLDTHRDNFKLCTIWLQSHKGERKKWESTLR